MLADVGDVERGLGGEQRQRLDEDQLLGGQAQRANRMKALERLLDAFEDRDELHRIFLAGANGFSLAPQRLLGALDVPERQPGGEYLEGGNWINPPGDVDH